MDSAITLLILSVTAVGIGIGGTVYTARSKQRGEDSSQISQHNTADGTGTGTGTGRGTDTGTGTGRGTGLGTGTGTGRGTGTGTGLGTGTGTGLGTGTGRGTGSGTGPGTGNDDDDSDTGAPIQGTVPSIPERITDKHFFAARQNMEDLIKKDQWKDFLIFMKNNYMSRIKERVAYFEGSKLSDEDKTSEIEKTKRKVKTDIYILVCIMRDKLMTDAPGTKYDPSEERYKTLEKLLGNTGEVTNPNGDKFTLSDFKTAYAQNVTNKVP
jgi:hypothetical protein